MVKMTQSNMGLQNNPQELGLRPILSRCTSLYRLVHCVGWKLGAIRPRKNGNSLHFLLAR